MTVRIIGRDDVEKHLDMADCIRLLRPAMIALARGETMQLPRGILHMDDGRMLGVMPGAMGGSAEFGVKIISIFPGNFARGLQSHQGPVVLFEPDTGAMVALVHAGEVTAIRTAAASALATDALARKDASRLAVLGYGEQARSHVRAMREVRNITHISVWGRNDEQRKEFAAWAEKTYNIECEPCPTVAEATGRADIVCTLTPARDPILSAGDVAQGTHINAVGSSHAGPAEIGNDLVAGSRFIADHRPFVLAQGGEFLRAREAGLVTDDHVVGEIGEVLGGKIPGRTHEAEITIYKSLGHVVQDLASAWYLLGKARELNFGTETSF